MNGFTPEAARALDLLERKVRRAVCKCFDEHPSIAVQCRYYQLGKLERKLMTTLILELMEK